MRAAQHNPADEGDLQTACDDSTASSENASGEAVLHALVAEDVSPPIRGAEADGGDPRARRRDRRQRARREREGRGRRMVVEHAETAHAAGMGWGDIAQGLQVPERTLRNWRKWSKTPPAPQRRGRPCLQVAASRRNEAYRLLRLMGPQIGLPALRALLPDLPRATLQEQLARYRRWWRRKHRTDGSKLKWLTPGAVWAMDFTETPFKIDARHRYLFSVRDLATHCHLCWAPVASERADDVIPLLANLFAEHGPPLVMKSDNGSAFIAEDTRELFDLQQIAVLYSPPRQPKYNGALERSNTTMKSWTAASAAAAGHPLHWTSADLEQALRNANELSRPWGHQGPSPQEAWNNRERLGAAQREALLAALDAQRPVSRKQLGFDKLAPGELTAADHRQIDRIALALVLQHLGHLQLTPIQRAPQKPRRPRSNQTGVRGGAHKKARSDAAASFTASPKDAMPQANGERLPDRPPPKERSALAVHSSKTSSAGSAPGPTTGAQLLAPVCTF